MSYPPISEQEAAGYVEHVLSCDDRLCGHYAHMWVKTGEGRHALRQAMRADRERARR